MRGACHRRRAGRRVRRRALARQDGRGEACTAVRIRARPSGAPDRCAAVLTALLDAAVSFRDKPALTHALAALPHLAAEDPARYGEHAARLPEPLDGLREKVWQAGLGTLVPVAAPAWASSLRTAAVPRIEGIVETLAEELAAGSPGPPPPRVCGAWPGSSPTAPRGRSPRLLGRLADAAGPPESAEHLAKYLLAPLLSREAGRPGRDRQSARLGQDAAARRDRRRLPVAAAGSAAGPGRRSAAPAAPAPAAVAHGGRPPPALVPALRGTASWAGRAGHGGRWTGVFTEVG
ncbi:hypothetical protein [Streptomyces sp. NPDC088757]|uniref:hypothetical protein n=1 Tax=Streptomyces sp. NPDC088757 TaxID=3365889 RepID=UPI00381FED20